MRRSSRGSGTRATRVAALLALALIAFAFQGSRSLWEPDEGRYVDIALEIDRLGDPLIPHLHAEAPHLAKPPLTYWALAGSLRILGRNEWAARIPNALAFLATLLLVSRLGRRIAPESPLDPAWIYGTFLLPFVASNVVSADTLLTLWETAAVYGFVELRWGPENRCRLHCAIMWLAFGLAFLTKGPPALLPLAAIVAFAGWVDGRQGLRRLVSLPGLVGFGLIGLGWYLAVIVSQPGAFRYFIGYELVGRVFTGTHDRYSRWYGAAEVYVPGLLLGSLPWTGSLLGSVGQGWRTLRQHSWRTTVRLDERITFIALWIVLPLAVFVVARSRMFFYVLPLFVPMALLVGRRLAATGWSRSGGRLRLAAWIVLLVALRGLAAAIPYAKDPRPLADALRQAVRTPIHEVAFVEVPPWYGLSFYLDAEVELVTIYPQPPARFPRESEPLAEELAADEGLRVFVVPNHHVEAFTNGCKTLGYMPLAIGGWRDFAFFELEERRPPPKRRPRHEGRPHAVPRNQGD